MRRRLLPILACLMMIPALLVAGCGDGSSGTNTKTSTPAGATSDSAGDRAKAVLASCKAAAENLPVNRVEAAKKNCQDSYDNITGAKKAIDAKTDQAVKKCKQAAEQIPNADAKAQALAACGRFQ